MAVSNPDGEDSVAPPRPPAAGAAAYFAGLLARLGAGGSAPALAYEALRRRLITYFRLHLPAEAEALADETLDRLARRLGEGVAVQEPGQYAFGIARLVALEARAREQRAREALADPTLVQEGDADAAIDEAALLAALRACLRRLGARSSALIMGYYAAGDGDNRALRARLAAEHQLSLNALRNRALRIREALERCMQRGLAP